MDYQTRRQLQSSSTRDHILQTALSLMKERGFDDVSIREICREAQVTTGAFYHHFSSKDVLLLNCFSPLKGYLQKALAAADDAPPVEKLRLLVTAYADYMSREGALLNKYYEYRLSRPALSASFDSDDYLRQTLAEGMVQSQAVGFLPASFSANEIAAFLHRHYRGIVIDWLLDNRSYSLKDLMLKDFDLLIAMFA